MRGAARRGEGACSEPCSLGCQHLLRAPAEQGLPTWLWLKNCLQNSHLSGPVWSPLPQSAVEALGCMPGWPPCQGWAPEGGLWHPTRSHRVVVPGTRMRGARERWLQRGVRAEGCWPPQLLTSRENTRLREGDLQKDSAAAVPVVPVEVR